MCSLFLLYLLTMALKLLFNIHSRFALTSTLLTAGLATLLATLLTAGLAAAHSTTDIRSLSSRLLAALTPTLFILSSIIFHIFLHLFISDLLDFYFMLNKYLKNSL